MKRFVSIVAGSLVVLVLALCPARVTALESKAGPGEDQFLKMVGDGLKKIQALFPPYFSRSPNDRLFCGALNGILREIDPSGNSYVSKHEGPSGEAKFTPGLQIRMVEGVPAVASLVVHSEAFGHDLQQGDLLLKIDDKLVLGKDLPSIAALLAGPISSTVKVAVFRPQANLYREEKLKRETPESVVYSRKIAGKIGYVEINLVDDKSVADFEARLKVLTREKLTGIVVDFRNTSGGTLEHAVRLADPFLPDKDRVIAKVHSVQGVRSLQATPKTTHVRIPVVVLQNQGTVGAAEIAAAALQDNHRAVLMGETTFGGGVYGSAERLVPDFSVQVATTYIFTPGGREIMGKGIGPDIVEHGELVPADKVKKFRQEFTHFCKGVVVTAREKDDKKDPKAQASPASAPTTGTPVDSDEDEEDSPKPAPGKPEKPSDQILDEFPLVKRHDTALMRALNLLISTNIFYEQLLQN
ncbi:MAG: hypothetical protein HY815_30790 [Candidatus Riflebacteria bacterium]|nr:hypothetical protein [Candidatus Riflebacteria bacterium]